MAYSSIPFIIDDCQKSALCIPSCQHSKCYSCNPYMENSHCSCKLMWRLAHGVQLPSLWRTATAAVS